MYTRPMDLETYKDSDVAGHFEVIDRSSHFVSV